MFLLHLSLSLIFNTIEIGWIFNLSQFICSHKMHFVVSVIVYNFSPFCYSFTVFFFFPNWISLLLIFPSSMQFNSFELALSGWFVLWIWIPSDFIVTFNSNRHIFKCYIYFRFFFFKDSIDQFIKALIVSEFCFSNFSKDDYWINKKRRGLWSK